MVLKLMIGSVVGGAFGFTGYKFVGCSTGACPLTSNPYLSTIYGAVLGSLLATRFS